MMITIHQRNQKVSNDDDTSSKSAQNSLPWVLPDTYITDRLTIQLILSLLALFSLFLPSTNKSLFKNPMFCFHWWLTIHQWTEFSISNSTYIQIPCVKYIPLLCRIWPTFKQKSSLFSNKVLEWYKHVFQIHNVPWFSVFTWWQDQSYSSANYIHCSAKLSVTVHNSQFPTVLSFSVSAQRLSFRFFFLRVITWVRSDWAPM